eukprot:8665741-Pyramimonas_sp.AAC.1
MAPPLLPSPAWPRGRAPRRRRRIHGPPRAPHSTQSPLTNDRCIGNIHASIGRAKPDGPPLTPRAPGHRNL